MTDWRSILPGSKALIPARPALGRRGAVVAPHHLATAAGATILRRGGNAVDAAIATNAALAVVAANMCGLGGDAFWLIWSAADRREVALNGSGRSAALAQREAVRSQGHDEMPGRGPLTITVPGAVHSWGEAHRRFGRLSWASLFEPAVELAEDGFPAGESWVRSVTIADRVFREALGQGAAGWRSVFLPDGVVPRLGSIVRLPALGATLRRIASGGSAEFYEGELAEQQAVALESAGALIRLADLRSHASTWGEPIGTTYRGTTVTTHPPNSSGIAGLELLNVLETFEPPTADGFGPEGPDLRWVHLTVEAAKLALADRDRFVTDPEVREVPVDLLLDKGRAAELARSIDPDSAATVPTTNRGGGGTVYLACVDAEGNAVSLIESNYAGFGSGIVDPATGIGYQNRGAYFRLDPTHPNALAPRKRTLHTLLPAMLFRDGEPWVVCGSMGGDAQPIVLAQLVCGLVDGRLDVAAAVSAPRVSAEAAMVLGPRELVVAEPRFRGGLLEGLEAKGHRVSVGAPFDSALGHSHAVEFVDGGPAAGGSVAAATDPRSEGLPGVQ